jgi:predicted AlkP superfamily phosphohydrolase/phosphomutase
MKLTNAEAGARRVVILGLDGLDPDLSARWMDAGLLPTFAHMREHGTFSPLTTTNPPETPAAWASFATGQNPGKTGIFDIVIRDPETYTPIPGMVILARGQGSDARLKGARRGTPMWEILGRRGLRATVLNLPVTWPPEPFNGRLLSGMGTPDLLGTAGRAVYYSSEIREPRSRLSVQEVRIEVNDGVVDTVLHGPEHQTLPLRFEIDAGARRGKARLQGQVVALEEKAFSQWCQVSFSREGEEVVGLCRFCLLAIEPELRIYCSPLQSHPQEPHVPISVPPSFAKELYQALGPYRTQGREVDIFNLLGGVLEDDVLLNDTFQALREREEMTQYLLRRGGDDLLISWFGVVDTTQHGYWRFIDPEHPRYTEEGRRQYGDAIQRVYQRLDRMVARVIETVGEDVIVIIVSDHGCTSWRRSVRFNTWLWREGFLALTGDQLQEAVPGPVAATTDAEGQAVPFSQVDWDRTSAYAVGCGKIYLNLRGREGRGTVTPGAEAEALEEEITTRLLSWRDPATGKPVVNNVYRSRDVQWGPLMDRAPELIVGLRSGYRIAWASISRIALGEPLVDNVGKLSGDHVSVDFKLVPGTLLSNVRLDLTNGQPHIMDIAPTVLDGFGLDVPDAVDGRSRWPR